MKKRKEITVPEDVFAELVRLAAEEKRSLNNYIEKILIDHVEQGKKKPG